jgi:hypothetical protein
MGQISRRDIVGGIAAATLFPALPARAALPVPASGRLGFDVLRGKRKLGEHVLTFARSGDRLTVEVAVDMAFKLGPVTLFKYRHRATERWQDGEVVSLDSTTNDDGTLHRVALRRDGTRLAIEADGKPRVLAPAGASPATHWNRRQLDGPLINTQTGTVYRPKVAETPGGSWPDRGGRPIAATRYALTGGIDLDLWYDATPLWAGLSFAAKDGSVVRYLRT